MGRNDMRLKLFVVLAALAMAAGVASAQQGAPRTSVGSSDAGPSDARSSTSGLAGVDGLFSHAQAAHGAGLFAANCARCHSDKQAAQLFLTQAAGKMLGAYHERLSTLMPPESAVRPDALGYLDIMAHLAAAAGARLGETDAKLEDQRWRQAPAPEGVVIDATASVGGVLPAVEWAHYRGDLGGQAYSRAAQIARDNVKDLAVVWRWSGASFGPSPEVRNITTPLMMGGVLYLTAGITRDVVALDATTGETLWLWRPQEDPARLDNAPRKGAGRGVAYWSDSQGARIFTVTPGFHLAALDAKTGRPVPSFGVDGVVDLMIGLRNAPKGHLPDIGSQSPPLVIGDVVVVGPAHLISVRPRSKSNVKGDVRGYDARTGELLWTFHTIPEKGEPGYETWEKGSAEYTGNTGVWAPMSADPETGAIFLPVEDATADLYGGERPGANLYSSSLVSLDGRTGKLRWARQLIHHDIWDWDAPALPILANIPSTDGTTKHAVLQITKQGFVYAFDRDSGEPLWPMEERPVPTSDVPGEQTSPTQLFPTRPAPFAPQGVTAESLIDFTPALHAEALKVVSRYRLGRLFTPASLVNASDGTQGTLTLPHPTGGGNWEGGAYDPGTGVLYVGSMNQIYISALEPAPEGADFPYYAAGGQPLKVRGLPIEKPPYGKITAIDMKTGEHLWSVANADTPSEIKSHPDLRGLSIPRTGIATRAGLLATPTLLFSGEGTGGGPWLHVLDKASGELLTDVPLPGAQTGLPMTYVWGGKQYVVMAVGDGKAPAEVVALALP
jgi:quinoprotein glucose dehydrogenase